MKSYALDAELVFALLLAQQLLSTVKRINHMSMNRFVLAAAFVEPFVQRMLLLKGEEI
jgi:hypothetical protein